MEDEQKLNLLRLAINNASDFEEAKSYASFIIGDGNTITTCAPRADNSEGRIKVVIEDGVYIVTKGLPPVPFGAVGVGQNLENFDVMVSYHGNNWIVAKEDLKGDELLLFSSYSHPEKTSSSYKRQIEALNDFDMESCTKRLRNVGIAFDLDADLYIPTVGQLAAMFLFRKELNEALELIGGTSMKEGVYWSSSEGNARGSWVVNFGSGYVDSWHSKCDGGYVRPCRTCELKGNSTHKG